MTKKGDRVIAVRSADDNVVNIFGYGTYEGEDVPPPGITGVFGLDLSISGIENPKIVLDNGDVVWGCECWWGDAERWEKEFRDRKLNTVSIDDYRKEKAEK